MTATSTPSAAASGLVKVCTAAVHSSRTVASSSVSARVASAAKGALGDTTRPTLASAETQLLAPSVLLLLVMLTPTWQLLTLQQRVGRVEQLHAHAVQRRLGGLNVQQVQDHRLVRPQHAPGRHLHARTHTHGLAAAFAAVGR